MQAFPNTVGPIYTQTITAGKHAYSMSQRVSIRWPPEDAYENTDTIVLSVNNFYVDLRVEKGPAGSAPSARKLDWATAGVRLVDANDPSMFSFFFLSFFSLIFLYCFCPFLY